MEGEIRDYALEIGFDDVGIATADPFPQLAQSLTERYEGYRWVSDGLLQLSKAADPRNVLPSARSLIVLLYDYYKQAYPPELLGCIGKSYQSRLYPGRKRLFGSRLTLFFRFLESLGLEVGASQAMPDRQAAVRAGIGAFGRNTFLYAPGRGSYVGIVTLAVNAELEPALHEERSVCREDCNRCIDACPTGALFAPFAMNPLRCIAFNTYGPGNFPGTPDDIPPEIRERMGSWIYGCDLCQDVCPRNSKRLRQNLVPDAFLAERASDFAPETLLTMDDEHFRARVQQVLYGYIWDKKFLQRNAAIVLGNRGDDAAVSLLSRALEDPEEMVRRYSAWALGRIGGARSMAALEGAAKRQDTAAVGDEIRGALEHSQQRC